MPVRDLGYRPYEGERLPPSHNTAVMLRHGLRRAWGSWLVKIAFFVGWAPGLLFAGYWLLRFRGMPGTPSLHADEAAMDVAVILGAQTWLFATMASLGAGAGAIAEDFTHRAFQFYFAKPVTPEQYLLGRIGAVALVCFALLLFPAVVGVASVTMFANPGDRLARAGLLLPALLQSGIVAVTLATVSVGLSSLSRSRALTMSAWVMVFIIPYVLSMIVTAVGHWPWLGLVSLPTLFGTISLALFRQPTATGLQWYHAVPALVVWIGGSVLLALWRVRRAEVIT